MASLKLALAMLLLASLPALAHHEKPKPKPKPPQTVPQQPGPTPQCMASRVKHNLFLMFLNAPPGQKDPDWTMQNAVSMEFDTCVACTLAANQIATSVYNTPTITLAGWCLPKAPEAILPEAAAQPLPGTVREAPPLRFRTR